MANLTNGQPFTILMDVGKYDLLMTKGAREFFNTYPKASELIIAEAVVLNSSSMRIMYNLLSKLNPPKFPFKAFGSLDAARSWLSGIDQKVN